MRVEKLTFQVRPSDSFEEFISADKRVWDPWLRKQSGFLGKTARVTQRVNHSEISLVIVWRTQDDLKSAGEKREEIRRLDRKLKSSFSGTFHLVHSTEI